MLNRFLSCCQIPQNLPVTIACHNRERCWSSSNDSRSSAPYANYPNLLLVYPHFPDVIAFGKDRKKQGVACHHPKLLLLQREGSIRVIVTSANLVSKQWDYVTNTVWWQDFPRRVNSDYAALFGTYEHAKSDFAAQLAGFVASLITNVPSQAHWIADLAKYDFREAACYLVASIPGIYVQNSKSYQADFCLSAKQTVQSKLTSEDFFGTIHSSVVGLNHRFNAVTDPNGSQLKILASLVKKSRHHINGSIEVLLKRNTNIPADANAVSIVVAELDKYSGCEGDTVQLGFVPRDVVKWLSPLSDVGFFSFSAFVYPKEALAAAFGGENTRVQLLLYVSRGPKFSEISGLIGNQHYLPLCLLLGSIQRCLGLWRLEEVLSRFRWPESLETDFMYGSSSIGSSISLQFLSTFSSAAGKKSCLFPDSEESDPEWGCWTASNECKRPSMRILFPTIDRVKSGQCGVEHYRRMLSFPEKTWQRFRTTNILHDAVPYPCSRVGYPMHVKVARRSFHSEADKSSFGWIYCGSHNFSPSAWGQIIQPTSEKSVSRGSTAASLGAQLRICNYELGIVLIIPPPCLSSGTNVNRSSLDDFALPFVMPAPAYKVNDRPATPQAMREALMEYASLETEVAEELGEDIQDEEEELVEDGYFAEEKEEDKIYAEMLWSQVDSTDD